MREPSDSAAAAAEILDRVGARWALMGALAALQYRDRPRFTTDADLLVEPTVGVSEAFVSAGYDVHATGVADAPDMLLVRGHDDRIDLLFASVEYLRIALERATRGVITVEDVIIQKLIAWRPRDQDDVTSILAAGHTLDDVYIDHWVAQWEVVDRWAEVTRGSGR